MDWKKTEAVELMPLCNASGRVLEIYRDVQYVFGVPHISSFFQYLGKHPRFLDQYWSVMRPIAASQAFFACAERMRTDAHKRVLTYFDIPDLKAEITRQKFSPGASGELKDCIDFFCHSVPMTLLLAAALSEAFDGRAGNESIPRTAAPTPRAHRRIVMVEEDSASPAVKAIFADIRATTSAEVVHTVYRAFARWPDFLQSYWTAVKPITVSGLFQHSEIAIREDALAITKELPGPIKFSSSDLAAMGMNATNAASLIRSTKMFVHSLAAALLNVSIARVAMAGGILQRSEPLPNAEAPTI